MIVQSLTTQEKAFTALREYRAHRDVYDKRDWEIERIYRQIARGKTVISVIDSIRAAGVDEIGRPQLAIMRADQTQIRCTFYAEAAVTFESMANRQIKFAIPWLGRTKRQGWDASAIVPRIPPQHRPAAKTLAGYHILWEADWTAIPRDPLLLRRIGRDAFVVLAAWDLTDVEMNVLRAHA